MQQVARNLTDPDGGALREQRYLLHDRDTKFSDRFRSTLRSGGVEPVRLPVEADPGSISAPSVDGDAAHFNTEPNHQGKGSVLLLPEPNDRYDHGSRESRVECRKRFDGLLRYYTEPHEDF
jgi:hypothetical protein